jgi:hypothetical protein
MSPLQPGHGRKIDRAAPARGREAGLVHQPRPRLRPIRTPAARSLACSRDSLGSLR